MPLRNGGAAPANANHSPQTSNHNAFNGRKMVAFLCLAIFSSTLGLLIGGIGLLLMAISLWGDHGSRAGWKDGLRYRLSINGYEGYVTLAN
jgi:hypothetical protein